MALNNQAFLYYTAELYTREVTLNTSNFKSNNFPFPCFLELEISVSHGMHRKIKTKIYDEREYCLLTFVNSSFLGPSVCSYGVFISQFVRFSRFCSEVLDFNERYQYLPGKLL